MVGWRKKGPAKTKQKKSLVAILISDRADFRARKVIRDKEGSYIMIKEPLLQRDVTILNTYVRNNRISNYVKQQLTELQREVAGSTAVGGFIIPNQEWTDPGGRKLVRVSLNAATPSTSWTYGPL